MAVNGTQVRIGIKAPREIAVDREEIAERKRRDRENALHRKIRQPLATSGSGEYFQCARGSAGPESGLRIAVLCDALGWLHLPKNSGLPPILESWGAWLQSAGRDCRNRATLQKTTRTVVG